MALTLEFDLPSSVITAQETYQTDDTSPVE